MSKKPKMPPTRWAFGVALTFALAMLAATTWKQIGWIGAATFVSLLVAFSPWITKQGLSVAERIGRSIFLMAAVSVAVWFYAWQCRPGWHLSGKQEDALAEAAKKMPKEVAIVVELFENSPAGQEYGHEIMDVLKENGATVNSITVFRGVDPTPVGLIVCAPYRGDLGYQSAGYMHWKMLTVQIPAKFQEDCPNADHNAFIIYVGSRPVE